jgi:transposase
LSDLSFEHPAQHLVLEELVQRVERAEMLGERIEHSMVELLPRWTLAPVVEAVQALRGISIQGAITLIAESGSFSRFDNPRQLMAYRGLVPSEHSIGSTVRRGPITETGNSLARSCLVEAAWTYRFPARVSRIILERTEHLPEPIRAVGWKAEVRLCRRYRHPMATGKAAPKVVTAIARELVGFIWAIARMVEPVRA